MAIDVRIRSKAALPRGGYNAQGVAVNQKVVVIGDIDITSYTTNGEPITPGALGLSVIDGLFISVIDVDGTLPTATNIHSWGYTYNTNLLVLFDGSAGTTDPDASAQVRFVAIGDSATPEL